MRRHQQECARSVFSRFVIAAGLLFGGALSALAQSSTPMQVFQTRYQVRMGEAVEIPADNATVDFVAHAKTRRVAVDGEDLPGVSIGPDASGAKLLLSPSTKAAPGEYTVTLFATDAAGKEMKTTVALAVLPTATVPKGSARNPVVLLNGWERGFNTGNACPIATNSITDFGNLASYLVSDGVPVVFLFDNCAQDAGQPIETLAADLSLFLNNIKYSDGTQVPQIDLVAHGMGGLIARAYIEGLQPNQTYLPPYSPLIGKLVLIATPNFGSFAVANLATAYTADSQGSEQIPGSALLWNLATWNQRGDDLAGVDAIAIVGNAGVYSSTSSTLQGASDGLVSTTSASLDFVTNPVESSPTRVVPYCHINPTAFSNSLLGTFNCNAPGIAYITDTDHSTGKIVRSFLGGSADWKSIGGSSKQDTYLATNGGAFFAMQNVTAGYATDLTAVNWGNVTLATGSNFDTIYYTDFVTGTGSFSATSRSLGSFNCGSLPVPAGTFAAFRCKLNLAITCPPSSTGACASSAITPLASGAGRAVTSGTSLTLNGIAFGAQCSNCKVYATPAGSTTSTQLTVASWTNTAITVTLPSSLTGYQTLQVNAVGGIDAIGVRAVAPVITPVIAVNPTGLNFTYALGDPAPSSQALAISNSGTGMLNWTATVPAADTWLAIDSTTGTAPSTVNVSIVPSALTAAGTYTSSITLSATGISSVTVNVNLVVSAPPPPSADLVVSPVSLTFSYTTGGALPPSQPLSITNGGGGTFTWVASSADYWAQISPASGSPPGTANVSLLPQNLAAGTYNTTLTVAAADRSVTPVKVAVTVIVQGAPPPAPQITGVANAGSFAALIAPAGWVAIFGTNLSQIPTPYTWQSSDFVGSALPASLQGVSVKINGIPAYVEYVSPTQINVLAPDDPGITTAAVAVAVELTVAGQTASFNAQEALYSPAFFTLDGAHVAAQHLPDFNLLNPSAPAKPGETIVLYGAGFGPTNPSAPTAQLPAPDLQTASTVKISIGGVDANVSFAGLSNSGLYQFNVTVPGTLTGGDATVTATIGGASTQTGVVLAIGQ